MFSYPETEGPQAPLNHLWNTARLVPSTKASSRFGPHETTGLELALAVCGYMKLTAAMSPAERAVRWPIWAPACTGVIVSSPFFEKAVRG